MQQRLHAAEEATAADSVLYGLLMTFLAKGILSAVTIHSIAKAAQTDLESAAEGKIFPKLKNLASLSHGRNALRQVNGMLAKESSLPMPKEISMPYTTGPALAHICLPHEYFAAMFEDKQQWHDCILPDIEALPRFWQNFQHHPCMDKHPVKKQKDWQRRVLPLSVHGDEVPVIGVGKIWCRSVLSFSWCSLVANALGAAGDNIMFYIWGIFEKYAQPGTEGTMQSFWTIMAWSFQTLNGRHLACERLERQFLFPFFSGRQEKRQGISGRLLCRPSAAFRRFRLQREMAGCAEQHCRESTLQSLPRNLTWPFDLLG